MTMKLYGNTHKENERSLPLTRDRPAIIHYITCTIYSICHQDQRFMVYADVGMQLYYAKRQVSALHST